MRDHANRPDEALRVALTLTQRQPSFGPGHYELGKCYVVLDKLNAAVLAFKAGVQLSGADFECALVLGQIYADNGDWHNAETYTRQALQKRTSCDEWYFSAAERLVLILNMTNRRAEAIRFADDLGRRLPDHPAARKIAKSGGRG